MINVWRINFERIGDEQLIGKMFENSKNQVGFKRFSWWKVTEENKIIQGRDFLWEYIFEPREQSVMFNDVPISTCVH